MSIGTSPVQQVAVKTTAGGSATKNVTISAPGAGNALRMFIFRTAATVVNSVTGGGVTWSQLATITDTASTNALELWGGDNSSGSGTTVAITLANTYTTVEVNISEWSGTDTAPVTDPAASTNTGTSNTITSPTATPTAGKNVLLLAAGEDPSGTITNSPSGGFTALTRSGTNTQSVWGYQVVASASGSYSATWADSVGYGHWATIIAGWDAAGAAPSGRIMRNCALEGLGGAGQQAFNPSLGV